MQLLQQVLGYCSPRELGALEATCSYFIKTGLTDRVAKHFLKEIPRAKGLKPDIRWAAAVECGAEGVHRGQPPPGAAGGGGAMAAAAAQLLPLTQQHRPLTCCRPLACCCSKGESYVTLLNFVTGQSNAAAQGTAIALGTYHTVGLFCRPDSPVPEYCMFSMGRGFHGQLGLEQFDNQHEPQQVRWGGCVCVWWLPQTGQQACAAAGAALVRTA